MPDMSKIKNFSEEDLELIREGFEVFDHGKQLTDINEILAFLDVLNASEKFPTVYNIVLKIAEQHPKGVNFKTFMETFQGHLGNTDTKIGLQKLFETIDYNGTQYLEKERLIGLAGEIGEKVSGEEIEYLIKEGYNCPDGYVNQHAFTKMILKMTSK